jgi:hypothetical protein
MCLSGRWLLDMIGFKNDYINIAFGIVWGTFIYTFFIVITGYIPWSEGIKLLRKLKKK